MNLKINLCFLTLMLFNTLSCNSQTKRTTSTLVGGGCEGCEAIFEYGSNPLRSIDTLPLFESNEPKLKIVGTVYKKDGKTPAKDVILYIYQTNRKGVYETRGDEKAWAKRHGIIRGWVKTDSNGYYTFYTFRPAAYVDGSEPEHIHLTVKEPNKNEYYLDDYMFDDDPILTFKKRNKLNNRGGSGIVKPIMKDGILTIERDLILGLNIPDYD
uniref:dioxygenase family protein n=1 Tax=Gelidibacter sp. TaxID=2018083 RepID=UPI00404A639F